jgi:hypothetical protein
LLANEVLALAVGQRGFRSAVLAPSTP